MLIAPMLIAQGNMTQQNISVSQSLIDLAGNTSAFVTDLVAMAQLVNSTTALRDVIVSNLTTLQAEAAAVSERVASFKSVRLHFNPFCLFGFIFEFHF